MALYCCCRLRRRKDLNTEELSDLNQLEQSIQDKKKQYHELEDVLPHENGSVARLQSCYYKFSDFLRIWKFTNICFEIVWNIHRHSVFLFMNLSLIWFILF